MQKLAIFFMLFFLCTYLHAQENILLKGQVIDAATKKPLIRAGIVVQGTSDFSITNDSGFFILRTTLRKGILVVSFIGYNREFIDFKYSNEQIILIKLERSIEQLKEVEVSKSKIEHLYVGEPKIMVLDYEFWDANTLIALYNYHTEKCSVMLLNKKDELVDEAFLPSNFEYFFYSCIHKTYAVTTDAVFEVSFQNEKLKVDTFNQKYFETTVKSYAGFKDGFFYIQLFDGLKFSTKYFLENIKLKKIHPNPFLVVNDNNEISKYKHDLGRKAEARKKDLDFYRKLGIDLSDLYYTKETPGEFIVVNEMEQKHKDVYAPLFVTDSLVMIFDHTDSLIRKFSFDTEIKSTTKTSYMLDKTWNRKIVYDNVQKKFYGVFLDKNFQSLKEISTQTGNALFAKRISYPDVRKIKVRNGEVYYLHAPFEPTGNVFLFKEKITE